MTAYADFITRKSLAIAPSGIEVDPDSLHPKLFGFQRHIVRWALGKGRAAVFADTGLGKTLVQLEWARIVAENTGGKVLILAPLTVAGQTVREGQKFGIPLTYSRDGSTPQPITITNYEMLDKFDPGEFAGVVIDESSCIKSFSGKFRTHVIESFRQTPYRLACTATPAPNDHMELGNHCEFLGVMTRAEMLAKYFVHDGGETQKWRIKGHAERIFWEFVCSWAIMLRKPSDLGYDDIGYDLPPLNTHHSCVDVSADQAPDGMLFAPDAASLQERQRARKSSAAVRVAACAEIIAKEPNEQWVVWCGLNAESEALTKAIPGAVEVRGSNTPEHKEQTASGFVAGDVQILVTKASIFGFGLNLQNCARMVFVGISDSWEQYYQAVRRCWRFGQTRPVDVHIVTASTEGAVLRNIERKEQQARKMISAMVEVSSEVHQKQEQNKHERTKYRTDNDGGEQWEMRLGDCVELIKGVDTGSIDYTVFSPPFASLYTYSDSDRDMGNCANHAEFAEHFDYLIPELLRVTRPGRLLSFHCMNLPTSKSRDGMIGLRDFRGKLIKAFVDAGWIYHSEVVIWKDPVTAMQRTKALGLLYKQLRKDSAMSRNGIPDYLVTMRAPGENTKRIEHTHESFPVSFWQRYASPVWHDINPSRTLNKNPARAEKDERHICPLQLDVIERALDLWSAEDDLVLSPFAGIGSEGYCAVRKGRRFLGFELKESYWNVARDNLREASGETAKQLQMFG